MSLYLSEEHIDDKWLALGNCLLSILSNFNFWASQSHNINVFSVYAQGVFIIFKAPCVIPYILAIGSGMRLCPIFDRIVHFTKSFYIYYLISFMHQNWLR